MLFQYLKGRGAGTGVLAPLLAAAAVHWTTASLSSPALHTTSWTEFAASLLKLQNLPVACSQRSLKVCTVVFKEVPNCVTVFSSRRHIIACCAFQPYISALALIHTTINDVVGRCTDLGFVPSVWPYRTGDVAIETVTCMTVEA